MDSMMVGRPTTLSKNYGIANGDSHLHWYYWLQLLHTLYGISYKINTVTPTNVNDQYMITEV